jgi:hypothetical protein
MRASPVLFGAVALYDSLFERVKLELRFSPALNHPSLAAEQLPESDQCQIQGQKYRIPRALCRCAARVENFLPSLMPNPPLL